MKYCILNPTICTTHQIRLNVKIYRPWDCVNEIRTWKWKEKKLPVLKCICSADLCSEAFSPTPASRFFCYISLSTWRASPSPQVGFRELACGRTWHHMVSNLVKNATIVDKSLLVQCLCVFTSSSVNLVRWCWPLLQRRDSCEEMTHLVLPACPAEGEAFSWTAATSCGIHMWLLALSYCHSISLPWEDLAQVFSCPHVPTLPHNPWR